LAALYSFNVNHSLTTAAKHINTGTIISYQSITQFHSLTLQLSRNNKATRYVHTH